MSLSPARCVKSMKLLFSADNQKPLYRRLVPIMAAIEEKIANESALAVASGVKTEAEGNDQGGPVATAKENTTPKDGRDVGHNIVTVVVALVGAGQVHLLFGCWFCWGLVRF